MHNITNFNQPYLNSKKVFPPVTIKEYGVSNKYTYTPRGHVREYLDGGQKKFLRVFKGEHKEYHFTAHFILRVDENKTKISMLEFFDGVDSRLLIQNEVERITNSLNNL